jgi:hypothetical protein
MHTRGEADARACASTPPRAAQESFSCRADGLPRKRFQFRRSTRISPTIYLAVSLNTFGCHIRPQLRTRDLRASRVPTAANRLQRSCTRAARRLTEVWRSVCRGSAGLRREGGKPPGDRLARWRLQHGARQDETTRYSTSITSDEAAALAAPAAALGSRGCAQSGGSTKVDSGAGCGRVEGLWKPSMCTQMATRKATTARNGPAPNSPVAAPRW